MLWDTRRASLVFCQFPSAFSISSKENAYMKYLDLWDSAQRILVVVVVSFLLSYLNNTCLWTKGWTWTISGSTVSSQSTNNPLLRSCADVSSPCGSEDSKVVRTSTHVLLGRDCLELHGKSAGSCRVFGKIIRLNSALHTSSNSWGFVDLTFIQAVKTTIIIGKTALWERVKRVHGSCEIPPDQRVIP